MIGRSRLRVSMPPDLRARVLERDNHRCRKCGRQRGLELHHIKAVARGGRNTFRNLITLCSRCHAEWTDEAQDVVEWKAWLWCPVRAVFFVRLISTCNGDISVHLIRRFLGDMREQIDGGRPRDQLCVEYKWP